MQNVKSMKQGGLFLLSLGVALCAAYGARQSPVMFDYIQSTANATASKAAANHALDAYNEARLSKELKALTPADLPTLTLDDSKSLQNNTKRVGAYVEALNKSGGPHAGTLEALRQTWLKRELSTSNSLRSNVLLKIPVPQVRLMGWLGESGFMFLLGMILMGAGAYLTRRAQKLSIQQSGTGTSEELDVNSVSLRLSDLSQSVSQLSEQALLIDEPMLSDANSIKERIEALQLSHFQPIVDARYRLQTQIGLGAFADVFSPFSSGERNLNRAWSTLVDEHWSESLSALGRAALALKRADESLQAALAPSMKG